MESVALRDCVLGDCECGWNEIVECTGIAAPLCVVMQFLNCWHAYDRHFFVFDELDRFELWTTDSGSSLDSWNYWSPFVKVLCILACSMLEQLKGISPTSVLVVGAATVKLPTYTTGVTLSVRCDRLCPLIGSASGTSAFSFVETLINARVK